MNAGDRISLIIPLQDEAGSVEILFRSIDEQSLPPDEVLVVDAGSTDDTAQRVRAISARAPLRIIEAGRINPGVARNTGAAAATLEWLAFTDGGIRLDKNWLSELAAAAREGTAVVYGNYEPVCDSFFKECAALAYVPAKGLDGTRGPSVASCLVRRAAFEAIGGFPAYRAAEDLIFIDSLSTRGFSAVFASDAIVHWQIANGVRGTYKRLASYSYHNLIAGWGRHWHLGVSKLYASLCLAMCCAALAGFGFWTSLLVPVFFVARGVKAAWVKRRSFAFHTLTVRHVAGTAGILAVVDVATLAGALKWASSKVAPLKT